ncbi:MAG: hypothetical protein GEV11_27940 [Streptosporangiales bacterium]|nr:hypothetical protein [Streptosporangiales bacterium]
MRNGRGRGTRARGRRSAPAVAVLVAALFAVAACDAGNARGPDTGNAGGGTPGRSTPAATPTPAPAADVSKELRRLETGRKARIGAYALDTGTGRTVAYRAGERFPSNSSFKAILCGAILDKARRTDPACWNA